MRESSKGVLMLGLMAAVVMVGLAYEVIRFLAWWRVAFGGL